MSFIFVINSQNECNKNVLSHFVLETSIKPFLLLEIMNLLLSKQVTSRLSILFLSITFQVWHHPL